MIGCPPSVVRPTVAALLVGLAACSGGEPGSSEDGSAAPAAAGEAATPGSDAGSAAPEGAPRTPPDARVADLGETLEFGAGHRATVYAVDLDARGEHVMMGQANTVEMIVIDAELCAGDEPLDLRVTAAGNFGLYLPLRTSSQLHRGVGGRNQTFDGETTFSRPDIAEPVGPGECVRGPVLVAEDADRGFTAAVFDTTIQSNAPEDQKVQLAWRLE